MKQNAITQKFQSLHASHSQHIMYDNLRELRHLRLEIYVIQNLVALELRGK